MQVQYFSSILGTDCPLCERYSIYPVETLWSGWGTRNTSTGQYVFDEHIRYLHSLLRAYIVRLTEPLKKFRLFPVILFGIFFFVHCVGNNHALAAKNCIRTRLCRFFFVLRHLINGIEKLFFLLMSACSCFIYLALREKESPFLYFSFY